MGRIGAFRAQVPYTLNHQQYTQGKEDVKTTHPYRKKIQTALRSSFESPHSNGSASSAHGTNGAHNANGSPGSSGVGPVAAGNIVTVKNKASMHFRKQGFVLRTDDIGHEEGPVRVWFGSECDHLYDFRRRRLIEGTTDGLFPPGEDSEHDGRIFNYPAADLMLLPDWDTELLIDRHWRALHHTITLARQPFVPGFECSVAGCSKNATARALFNIWGHVFSADVCGDHKEKFHLKRIDDFPWRKKPAATQPKPFPMMPA